MKSASPIRLRLTAATAVAALLVVMAFTDGLGEGRAAAAEQRPAPPMAQASVADAMAGDTDIIDLERLKRSPSSQKTKDIFRTKSWYVPPPPPPPAPPPAPTAPPLPFSFLGTVQESDGNMTIFLSGKDRVYLIKSGDTIDGTYHVDGIENGQLALTYLPLRVKQYLNMGEAR